MGGGVLEAGDLRVLGRQVPDRVEDQVREREGAVDLRRREVTDRDPDVLGTRLLAQPGDHRLRHVDPVNRHSALRERERDPPGPDAELEGPTIAGELGQEVDDGVEHRRLEHLGGRLVVPSSNRLVEVPVVLHGRNLHVRCQAPDMAG